MKKNTLFMLLFLGMSQVRAVCVVNDVSACTYEGVSATKVSVSEEVGGGAWVQNVEYTALTHAGQSSLKWSFIKKIVPYIGFPVALTWASLVINFHAGAVLQINDGDVARSFRELIKTPEGAAAFLSFAGVFAGAAATLYGLTKWIRFGGRLIINRPISFDALPVEVKAQFKNAEGLCFYRKEVGDPVPALNK